MQSELAHKTETDLTDIKNKLTVAKGKRGAGHKSGAQDETDTHHYT